MTRIVLAACLIIALVVPRVGWAEDGTSTECGLLDVLRNFDKTFQSFRVRYCAMYVEPRSKHVVDVNVYNLLVHADGMWVQVWREKLNSIEPIAPLMASKDLSAVKALADRVVSERGDRHLVFDGFRVLSIGLPRHAANGKETRLGSLYAPMHRLPDELEPWFLRPVTGAFSPVLGVATRAHVILQHTEQEAVHYLLGESGGELYVLEHALGDSGPVASKVSTYRHPEGELWVELQGESASWDDEGLSALELTYRAEVLIPCTSSTTPAPRATRQHRPRRPGGMTTLDVYSVVFEFDGSPHPPDAAFDVSRLPFPLRDRGVSAAVFEESSRKMLAYGPWKGPLPRVQSKDAVAQVPPGAVMREKEGGWMQLLALALLLVGGLTLGWRFRRSWHAKAHGQRDIEP